MNIIERLYTAIEANPHIEDFSGVILVKQGGKELYFKVSGYANRAHDIFNKKETQFGTASGTKMFTAVAVLQLIQNGKISFDTRVNDHLRLKHTKIPEDVSVFHLLTHTSGIDDYFDEAAEETASYAKVWQKTPNYSIKNLTDMLPLFVNKPSRFAAGKEFRYSNAGYILLGLVIEKASGISYFDYVKENVFIRVQMSDAAFFSLEHINRNVAEGYIPIENSAGKIVAWKRNIYTIPFRGASDGGAFVTAQDCTKFMANLRSGVLLSDNLTKDALVPKVTDTGDWKYGYGLWFQMEQESIIRYGHAGEDPGVSCRIYYYPSLDIDLVVLSNHSAGAGPMMDCLHRKIMEQ